MAPFETIGREKSIESPAQRLLAAWCPTMDLIAYGLADHTVYVYRMNGQKIWHVPVFSSPVSGQTGKTKDRKIVSLGWSPDGTQVAIGYDNFITRIIDTQTGKLVHKVDLNLAETARVTTVGWVADRTRPVDNDVTLHNTVIDVFSKVSEDNFQYLANIFQYDANQVLPKLSNLPGASSADTIFSIKANVDGLINNPKTRDDYALDILFSGTSDGRFIINIFDSFAIGPVDLSSLINANDQNEHRITHHAATYSMKTHLLLTASKPKLKDKTNNAQNDGPTILHAIDLLFLSSYGPHLGRVAYTVTKVQHVLRYISETLTGMATEFKSMENVAATYMRAHAEIIKTTDEGQAGLEFFELLVTGCASAEMREWVVDSLGEKGQKKWEKVGSNAYEYLRRLAHEHLLPACDRLVVLLSKLRGLARWTNKDSSLGLDPVDYSKLLDIVAGLLAIGHEFLGELNHEFDLFNAFMHWLKGAHEELNSLSEGNEPDPQLADSQLVDILKVAEYIDKHLKRSVVAPYFDKSDWPWKEGESVFELTLRDDSRLDISQIEGEDPVASLISGKGSHRSKKQGRSSLKSAFGSQTTDEDRQKQRPGFHQMFKRMNETASGIFEKPAQAMRQQVRLGQSIVIHDQHGDVLDMFLCEEAGISVCYVAISQTEMRNKPQNDEDIVLEEDFSLVVVRIELVMEGNLSSVRDVSCARLELPPAKLLSSMKFIDKFDMIVLLYDEDQTCMQTFSYTPVHIPYVSCPRETWSLPSWGNEKHVAVKGVYNFSLSLKSTPFPKGKKRMDFNHKRFTPVAVAVNGLEKRRLGSVLDRERQKYLVFDLGSHEDANESDEEEAEDEGGDDEEEGEEDDEEEEEENASMVQTWMERM